MGEIQGHLGFKQPGLSQQLAELRQAGVVQTRRESRQIYYSIADLRVAKVLDVLLPIFCGSPSETGAKPAEQPSTRGGLQLGEMAQWAVVNANITSK